MMMDAAKERPSRFEYLFTSTKGLVLLGIGLIGLVTAVWGTLSGPMVEWGVKDITVRVLNMDLNAADREGRIISLYHSIAFAVVAILTYLITRRVPMKRSQAANINATVTVGYLVAGFGGLGFGYFGHNWTLHGLFLVGQAILFFGGAQLAAALWPWQREYRVTDPQYAHTRKGTDLERVAYFVMTVSTLGSAALGAVAGSYLGNGFETFLAENVVRAPIKTVLEEAVIGHLHIMLTLIAIALALLIGDWFDFKGVLHKFSMPLMIAGTLITTLGAWSVVVTPHAHTIIYVGAVFILTAALLLVIYGWRKMIRDRLSELGIQKAGFGQRMRALLHDPLRFGSLWQMVYMNFTVSGVGIFMAVQLDEIFRVWPHREERIALTGHWHNLSGLIATIILLHFADMMGLKGRLRQWFGWIVILGYDLASGAVTVFSLKRLFVTEYTQQAVVNWTMVLTDIGLASVLVMLAALLIWRLIDLGKANGRWIHETGQAAGGKEVESR